MKNFINHLNPVAEYLLL